MPHLSSSLPSSFNGFIAYNLATTSVRGGLEVDSGSIEIEAAKEQELSLRTIFGSVAIGQDGALKKEAWMTELESRGHSINFTGVQEKDKSWNVKQSGLTPEAAVVVTIAVTAATMWSGGVGGAAAQSLGLTTSAGGLTTTGIVVAGSINAGVGTLASRTAVSAINNRFDLSKVAREVTSEESLKDIGRSMLIGGATAGLQKVVDLEKVTAGVVQLPELGQRAVQMTGRGLVQASVSSLVTGEKFGDALKSAAGSTALALGQSVVGDVGVSAGLGEGSLGKVAMHGGLGGLYSKVTGGTFASGAIGGGVGETVAGLVGSGASTGSVSQLDSRIKAVSQIAASTASFVSGGSVGDITTAGSVALSSVENNYDLHQLQALRDMEASGEIEVGTVNEDLRRQPLGRLTELIIENPIQALDVTTDVISIATAQPEIAIGKRALVSGVKKGLAYVGLGSKVEKITGPVGGKVIEHGLVPRGDIVPVPSKSVVIKDTTPGTIGITTDLTTSGVGIAGPPSVVAKTPSPLLPNEGRVGTYRELGRMNKPGDNTTAHHIPSAAYMKQFGVKKSDGVSIMVEEPVPGAGGRHRRTDTYGKKPNLVSKPRHELAKDILDLRNIYKEDSVYTPEIRGSLQEVIKRNKEQFPEIFLKEPKK